MSCFKSSTKRARIVFALVAKFNTVSFTYLKCNSCSSDFVDPVPDGDTFTKMYAKAGFHDCFYQSSDGGEYVPSVQLLKQFLPAGASLLVYGCGVGGFLQALGAAGFVPFGVEFDRDAVDLAAQRAGCNAISVDDFQSLPVKPMFDVIHFGDVLDHLPDPAKTLNDLLVHLKPGGILYVEDPLEINPSPVYWTSRLFGAFKRIVRPAFVASDPPTNLIRTGATQQLAFFSMVEPGLVLKHWRTYETGWRYAKGGEIQRAFAAIAMRVGGKRLFGMTFGNSFRGIFTTPRISTNKTIPTSVQ